MLKAALDLLTAEPRPEERKGLEIAIDQASSAVARAQDALDRLRPLVARKEASAAQMFDAEQLLVQAQLGQKSAEAQLALLLAGPRPEAVAESKARLGAAEEALKLAQEHLALHSIRSPIDGVLDSLTCHPGQTVAAGFAIGEIVQASQVNVVVWLPPLVASKVAVGQTARLEIGGVGSKPAVTANEQDQHEPGESTEAAEQPGQPADEHRPAQPPKITKQAKTGPTRMPRRRSKAKWLRSAGSSTCKPAICRFGCWSTMPTARLPSAKRCR